MTKDVHFYLSLPYRIELIPEPEVSAVVARIPDLPGCITQGDSSEEALRLLEGAKEAWIKTAIARGLAIREPRVEDEFRGRVTVRMTPSLHRRIANEAAEEGISQNQYIVSVLQERSTVHLMARMMQRLLPEEDEASTAAVFRYPSTCAESGVAVKAKEDLRFTYHAEPN